jgi:hypothetical protein
VKSLRSRLERLEQQFGETSAARQLSLLTSAIYDGDAAAAFTLEGLRASGKGVPIFLNLWDLYRNGPVKPETEKREEPSQ